MNTNPLRYWKCDLRMRKTQPTMKKEIQINNQLPLTVIHSEFIKIGRSFKQIETAIIHLFIALMVLLPVSAHAVLTLPAIPSNTVLASRFELSTEMVFRVKVGENYLASGALIAYVNGEIRGAQTASVKFPATGINVYKVMVFNDKAGDSISFKYYDIYGDKIYDITEKIAFVPNSIPDFANAQILTGFCKPIEKVSGLLPENGKENVNATLDLFWQPSPNTTYYKVYVWEDGTATPTNPLYSNVYSTSVRVYNLNYGKLYRWKIASVNDCSEVESPVQAFKIRQLPDLTVTQVQAPASLESGTNFSLSFTVKNIGIGHTGGTAWNDLVFVSTDATFSNDDKLLSNTTNIRQLNPDSSYTRNVTVALPIDYSGNYYFIVKTDYYNSVAELLDNNNEAKTSSPTAVTLKTLPDILVKDIQAGATIVNPGDSLTVSWKVENIGGTSAKGGWAERISIVPVSGVKLIIPATTEYKDSLAAGSTINRSRKIKIPNIPKFSGNAKLEVELIPFPELVEYTASKANNTALSAGFITLPDILSLEIQSESVLEGTPTPVRCIVNRSGNFSTGLVVTLSASIPGQVTIPATVSIPVNQSSVIFNLLTVNNTILEGKRTVDITAGAPSYTNSVKTITILDDEIPKLTATLSKSSANEGDTIVLTVKRNLVTDQPVSVSVSTNKPTQWTFVTPLIIPANVDSGRVSVFVTDDNIPELRSDATLFVSAAGVTPGQVTAFINDNDIPQVKFEILSDTVSESAGAFATWGVLTRVKGDGHITVNLTQTPAGALYFPTTLNLPKGVGSQKFNIGVVDNGDVDGYRKIKMTGSIYISSCNCNTSAENGGIVTDSLVIADNDGPSLSVSVFPLSLPEGKQNAGTLTISRNTSTEQALEIAISHNDTTEVTIQKTATIPAGQKSVQVPVHTINDNIEDGNQMVLVQVSAPAFSSGFGYVFVTDLNKPDMEITDIQIDKDTAATNETIEITGSALNSGFGTAPSGVKIKFYYSTDKTIDTKDKLLGEFSFPSPILQGAAVSIYAIFEVPNETGKFFVLSKINPDQAITELAYFNNEAEPVELFITPEYNATAIADSLLYKPNTVIPIRGSALNNQNVKIPDADVDVYIITNGTRRELKAKTNSSGDYTVDFVPVPNESGHFVIGACYPKQNLGDKQDEFNIPGIRRESSSNIIWDMLMGQTLTGKIAIKNTSGAPLNKLVITADKLPNGCELVFDTIASLAGNQVKEFSFNIKATQVTAGRDYEKINFTVKSAEGISTGFPAYYYCQALQAQLKSSPVSINTTMTKGKSRIYELYVYNNGAGESGEVNITLPNVSWMKLISPAKLANIASQDTINITLSLEPTADAPLNTPITGSIAVNCANGSGVAIPYRIEAVSEETGGLKVDVIDEYTYYTEAKPHVKNAHVVVRHPFSGKIVAEGFTNANGIFEVSNLPEGAYRMNVEAEKHEGFQTTITIDPGRVNEQTVFLSFQAISYTWEVVPTEIEDNYEVQLIMKFETNVPVPVVVMEMPSVMPQLFNDETYPFMITITNKGLITAKDVEIKLPQSDPEYIFLTNFAKMDLLAQQAIQVPVVMKLRSSLKSAEAAETIASSGPCTDYTYTVYGWECGPDKRWHQTSHGITFSGRVCPGGGGGGGGGGWGGWGGGSGPSRGGTSVYYYTPSAYAPAVSAPTAECDNCLTELALAILGCVPGPVGTASGVAACLRSAADGDVSAWDIFNCAIGFVPGVGCVWGLVTTAITCYQDPPIFVSTAEFAAIKSASASKMPPILRQSVTDLEYVVFKTNSEIDWISEMVKPLDWKSKESFADFLQLIDSFTKEQKKIQVADSLFIVQNMVGTDITSSEIGAFVSRWNKTMTAWKLNIFSPTPQYPDIIDDVLLRQYKENADSVQSYMLARGYSSVGEMYNQALEDVNDQIESGRSSVCSSVTINISQKVVMTREAFEGTLTIYNGNKTTAMKEIKLNLQIKDENGVVRNDLFEIETKALDILTGIDGTGVLGADQKGSATVLFIPEKGAAPTVPKGYSFGGSFSYLDPFSGVTVTKPLFPVTLDVNPSPDLTLHYFMQRDILGDDPLTEPIEPIVPAELAVMVENNGYGTAKNVRIESAQPKIVENEKGLAINFALIGSNLNGQPTQLGLTNINFGNIEPKKAKIGQWWFTSDLLGHFISYETKLTHLDSRGNPDLSLISAAILHELIKSIRVYTVEDGINDFLVNEVQDAKETPDIIFLSNGGTLMVNKAISSNTLGSVSSGIQLLVTPETKGWNYDVFNDPGNGNYKILSVTRSDGQVIPPDNVWQTHVTLPDGKEPVYENKIHFIDEFATHSTQQYTILFAAKDQTPPEIINFENVPTSFVTSPVTSINVVFNKPIDASTFNYKDMTLRVQAGADIMDSTVVVTQLSQTKFKIDLTSKSILDGFYVLNVQTAGIKDLGGTNGKAGKQANWTQFIGIPAVTEFIGLPANYIGDPIDLLLLRFNLPIDKATLTPARLVWKKDGSAITGTVTIIPMDTEGKLYQVSGLQAFMSADGKYSLTVDLPNIKSLDAISGAVPQSVEWTIDQTAPTVSQITPSTDGGYDSQHNANFTIVFNEPVTGVTFAMLELWKDGQRQPLSQLVLTKKPGSEYLFTQFRMLTYYEGNYLLKVKMKDIADIAGNSGTDTIKYEWVVNRSLPVSVTNLRITPDMGHSDTDAVTATKNLVAHMTVNENNSRIRLYQTVGLNPVLLADTSNVNKGPLSLPVVLSYTGNSKLEARCSDVYTNTVTASIPLFIDEANLTGTWKNVPATAVGTQLTSLQIEFSDKLLDDTKLKDYLTIERNSQQLGIQNVTVTKSADKLYTVSGINLAGNTSGIYKIGLDATKLYKHSSGKQGVTASQAQWTVQTINKAPVANAGADQTVDENTLVTLNGSASSDPDGDAITYLWVAPAGISLSSATAASPTFTAPDVAANQTFTFSLTVRDSKVNSTTSQVKVNVRNISGPRLHTIALTIGWNIFSVNVIPEKMLLDSIFKTLIDEGSLVKVQDEKGNSFEDWGIFGGWTNNIGNLKLGKGFKIKVKKASQFSVYGNPLAFPFKIALEPGWNIIGYPHSVEFDVAKVVQQLLDRGTLVKVQDERGSSYEDWGVFGGWTNNIGNFIPGEGYKIKLNAKDTLTIYESYSKNAVAIPLAVVPTVYFKHAFKGNGVDHMNINVVKLPVNEMNTGDEIAVFDGNACVGAVSLQLRHLANRTVSIPVSAADGLDDKGFTVGNRFTVKLWNSGTGKEYTLLPEIIKGTPIFVKNETTQLSPEKYVVTGFSELDLNESELVKCYPNPFTGEISIEVYSPEPTSLSIDVIGQDGRIVKQLAINQQIPVGTQLLKWNGTNSRNNTVATGIYYLKIRTDNKEFHKKVVLNR